MVLKKEAGATYSGLAVQSLWRERVLYCRCAFSAGQGWDRKGRDQNRQDRMARRVRGSEKEH